MREPGIPVYLRAPSRVLVSLAFLAFGCVMAYLGVRLSWVLVLVLCFVVGVSLTALARMEWAILGLVVMSNFDGFLKPLFAERFSLFFKDYFVLLALLRWVWGLLSGEERPSLRTTVAIPAGLFIGYVFAELANPNAPSLLASLAGIRAWIIWIPVFFAAYDYMRSRAEIERLWIIATLVSGIVAAYGIVQYFIGFEHLYAISERFQYYAKMGYVIGPGQKVLRVFSTMVHPGTFGGAMGFMLLAGSGIAFGSKLRTARITALVCLPLIIVGLFLSGARSAMIGAGIGLLVFVVLSRRPGLILAAAALLALGYWQTTRLTGGAIEKRLETVTWEYTTERTMEPLIVGFDTALRHPFGLGVASGVGIGRFGLEPGATKGPFLENDFGRALGELGIGALLYFLLLVAAVYAAASAYLRTSEKSAWVLAAALMGAMTSILTTLATGAALYLAPGAPYFWLALASVLRLSRTTVQEKAARHASTEAPPLEVEPAPASSS